MTVADDVKGKCLFTDRFSSTHLTADPDQPLIGIITHRRGRKVDEYFMGEEEADRAIVQDSVQRALALAGARSGLDWDEREAALEQVDREGLPTPPIA